MPSTTRPVGPPTTPTESTGPMPDSATRPPGWGSRFLRSVAVCLAALPWGIVVFTVAVTGLSLGAGLAIVLIGLPILAVTLHLARHAADLEAAVLRWATGAGTRRPGRAVARSWGELWSVVGDGRAWGDLGRLALRLPVGIVTFTLTVVLMTVSAAYLSAPLIYRWASIWSFTGEIQTSADALLAVPQGVAMALVAAFAIPAMARLLAAGGRSVG